MEIFSHPNGPFVVNTYLIVNNGKAIIIDPGAGVKPIVNKIAVDGLSLEAIIATHGHIDHVDGVNVVKEKFDVPFYANEKDLELIETVQMQARMFGVKDPGRIIIDRNLPCEGLLNIADLDLELLYTPGHSKGSVSIKIGETLFSGDTLFNFSIGRTDLPGGDYEELINSIKTKIFTLTESTVVLSGHGPKTTVGRERKMNPFFS
jgi:glyoxylase-like metal-dependent hydrolase (beta-lactamase superfamily II)